MIHVYLMHYVQEIMIFVFDATEDTICLDTLNFTIDEIDGFIEQEYIYNES